ncbi:MAG: PIN domain-containing protein [Candidatus Aenigmatarchaeota archaeon]
MRKILVDSDIIIDVLRNFRKTKEILEKISEEDLYISGITELEIFAGEDMKDEQKKRIVTDFLSKFKKINPNNEIFQLAGEFRRKYKLPPLDCIIAATVYLINA